MDSDKEVVVALLILAALIVGFFAGVLVNVLADEIPCNRGLARPVYADGTPRPLAAWSGLGAFIRGLRQAPVPQPNEARERRDREGNLRSLTLTWRYPLTEIATMVVSVIAVFAIHYYPMYRLALGEPVPDDSHLLLQLVFWWAYIAIYILITVIDLEYQMIYRRVIYPSAVLAILNILILPETSATPQDALYGALTGFIPFFILYMGGFLFIYVIGELRGEEINTVPFGYGDVMLMTLTGLLIGFSHTFFALFITAFLGALGSLLYMIGRALFARQYTFFSTALPYGPYIVFASLLMLLYGDEVRRLLIHY